MSYVANCLRKFATFRGRSSRKEFWNFFGLVFLINVISQGLDKWVDNSEWWQQIDAMEEISFEIWALFVPIYQVAVLVKTNY